MTKKIQAYFENEDQALKVKDKLLKFETRHLEIGDTGNSSGSSNVAFLPLIGAGTGGGVAGNSGMGGFGGFGTAGVVPVGWNISGRNSDFGGHSVVLSGEINDEFYEQALDLIENNHGQAAFVNEV